MTKIPFDIKYRPQIESGEYRVETFSGYPVTIYRWDFDDGAQTPIMGSYVFEDGEEYVGAWSEDGHFDLMSPNDLDLFIVTPEEELTDFESNIRTCITENLTTHVKYGIGTGISSTVFIDNNTTKKLSSELLSLVREQFVKDGYVIEKKEFHDAVKKIDPEVMKEVSEAIDLSNFEYAMLRYVQEGANVKDDEELIKLTKKYSKELLT